MNLEQITARARSLAADVCQPLLPLPKAAQPGVLRDVQAVKFGPLQANGQQAYVIEISLNATACMPAKLEKLCDAILAEMDAEGIPARIKKHDSPIEI